jgi:hypothetical protein
MRLDERPFYLIFNPDTEAFKTVYGTTTMPALYVTRHAADGELRKQKKQGSYTKYEVVAVKLERKYKV